MNKVYRVIFNHATQTWTAVSELAKGRTKTKSEKVATLAVAVSLALGTTGAYAATQILDGRLTRPSTEGGSVIIAETLSGDQNVIIGSRIVGNVTDSIQSVVIGNDILMQNGRGSIAIGGDDAFSARGLGTVAGQNFAAVAREAGGFDNAGYRKLKVTEAGAIGIGTFAVATGKGATAVGLGSTANVEGATSYGTLAFSTGTGSSAFGLASRAEGSNTLALGAGARATQAGSIAIGAGSVTTEGVAVTSAGQKYDIGGTTYDPLTNTDYDVNNVVSVGNATVKRQIQNVAPGQITETSTDAINGSQLYAITKGVQQIINNNYQTIQNNINNSGFHLKNNAGATVADVNKDDSLTFKNGTFTTATVNANREVAYNVVTQNINVANGVPTETGTAGLATAQTVATAIKNSGFNLQANGQNGSLIKAGDTVSINQGDNTEVVKSGNTITVHANKAEVTATESDIKLDTKVTGRTTAYNISLSDTVKEDIAKGVQALAAVEGFKGSVFSFDGDNNTTTGEVSEGNITFAGSENIITTAKPANDSGYPEIEIALAPDITVDNVTVGAVKISKDDGINAGDKTITGVANAVNANDAVNLSQLNATKVSVVGGANITSVDSKVTDNGTTYTINAKDTSASVSNATGSPVSVTKGTEKDGVTDYVVDLTTEAKASLEKANTAVQSVTGKDGIVATTENNAVTVGLTPESKASLQKADSAIQEIKTTVNGQAVKTLNQADNTQDFKNGTNIDITTEDGKIIVATKPNVEFTSVNTNMLDAKIGKITDLTSVKMSTGSITATTAAVDNLTADNANVGILLTRDSATIGGLLTANGGLAVASNQRIDMGDNQVHNVKAGTADTDAVNVSQLKANTTTVAAGKNITSVNEVRDANGIRYTIDGKDTTVSNAQGSPVSVTKGTEQDGVTDYVVDLTAEAKTSLEKANTAVQNVTGKDGITAEKQGDTVTVGLTPESQASLKLADSSVQSIVNKVNGQVVNTLTKTANEQNFINGTNIVVSNENGDIKVSTSSDVSFTNVTVGDVKISQDAGINAGGKKITNVEEGVDGTDAVNVSQLNKRLGTHKFLVDADNSLQGQGDAVSVTSGSGLTITGNRTQGGEYSTENVRTAVTQTGVEIQFSKDPVFDTVKARENITVGSGNVLDEGVSHTHITSDGVYAGAILALPTNPELVNSLTKDGLNIAPSATVKMGGNRVQNVADGTADKDAVNVSQLKANTTTVVKGNNVAVTENKTADGITYTIDAKDTTVSSVNEKALKVTKGTETNGVTDYALELGDDTKASLQKADSAVQTIVNQVNGQTVKTLTKDANTQDFVNGDNIEISNDNGAIKVATAKTVAFDKVTVGTASIDKDAGINAGNKTIQGVANGQNENDAVNVSQLNEVKNALQSSSQNHFHTNTGNNIGGDPETNYGAVGQSAGATALNSLAAGINAKATAEGASAVGHGAVASGQAASAIGQDSKAEGVNSVAIGIRSEALGLGSLALGETSKAHGEKALAWGGEAQAMERMTVAIGDRAIADKQYAFAMGAQSRANADYSVVIGTNAEAKETALFGTAIGKSAIVTGSHSTAIGVDSQSVGDNSIALGRQANSTGVSTVALGHSAATTQNNAIAVGSNSTADGANSIAVGRNASTQQDNSIALGTNAKSQAVSAVAIGNAANVTGINAVGVGYNSSVKNLSGSAFGRDSSVSSDYGTALGANAVVGENLPSSVALGAHSEVRAGTPTTKAEVNGYTYTGFAGTNIAHNSGANSKVVSVGSVGSERQIQNVAAGQITATSTDAINGSQLFRVIERVESGKNFTGNTGDTTNLRFGETLNIAGDATTQGTYSSANIKTVMTDNNTGGVLKIQIADNPEFKDITATSIKTGDNVLNGTGLTIGTASITNADGINAGNKTIQGVADATKDDEAVNLSQLNATKNTINTEIAKGLNFSADSGNTVNRKLGDTLAITGGNGQGDYSTTNVRTVTTADGVRIELADNPTFKNVKATDVSTATLTTTGDASIGGNANIAGNLATTGTATFGGKVTANGGMDLANNQINNVADGTADKDAVNVSQLRNNVTTLNNNIDAAKTELTAKGLDFSGNTGETHRDLGTKLAITGEATTQGNYSGANLKTVVTETGVALQFADNPEFKDITATSIKTGDNVLNGTGLTIGTASITNADGINAGNKTIKGVANATKDDEAVNLAQLKAQSVTVKAGQNVNSVNEVKTADGITYTIDAKDTTVSKGSNAVTVEKGIETNGVTDYRVDLSAESKESLEKADSALQEIETQIDGVAVKTVKKDDNTANFITGDNIVLTAENGGIKVATAKEVTFDKVNSTVIEAVDARINNVQADDIVTLNLTSTHANINTLESHQIRAGDIKASTGTITDLTSNHITANSIDARSVDVISLTAKDTKTDTLATTGNAQIGGKLTVQNGIDATNNRIENVANATRNGDAVNLAQLKANTTTVVAGANITSVDKVADENGVTYTINAKDTSATVSNASSAVTVVANGTTNGVTDFAVDLSEETKESLKKANSGLQTIKTKVNGEDVKTLDQNDNVQEFVNGDNIEITNDNGKIKVATKKAVEFDKVTVGTASIDKDAGINAGNKTIQGVADGTADKDAVNVSQLRDNVTTLNNNIDAAKTELTNKGLDFSGNTGETHRDLGTKLAITGEATTQGNYSGANLKTVVTETGVALQFADNPEFKDITATSIKTGDNVLNGTGLTIGTASITNADGINAGNKTIQGVADATKDDEAVNLSQLNATKNTINTEIAKGLNFSADSGDTVNRKLGDTLAITGGNGQGDYSTTNVRTITTANGVEIQLADNPTFNNVKASDVQTATLTTTGTATIGGMLNANGGLTVANGQTVQMGNNRVQGVANAVESTDAVNLSQLNATKVSVVGGANITSIDTKVTDNGTTYTINAKDTSATVSSANEKALKVTQGAENNGITDFALDLGDDTKASLAKADTAVQNIQGQGGITATKGADNVVTVDLDEATKANLTKADTAVQEIETQIDGKTVKTVKKGDNTANFITGDNIELTDENGAIKVATKKDVTFTNVNTDTLTATTGTIGTLTSTTINNAGAINTQTLATTGTATIGGMLNANGGLTVANGQTVNMGNNTISNVASGGDVGTNAANIDDVKRLAKSADTTASTSGTNGIEVLKVEQNGQVTDYQVGLTKATRDDIAKGVQASDDVANKGLTFTGDTGTTTAKKLGDSLAITGDDNISTTATANGVAISLNRNLTADSLSIGNVVINNAGINAGNQVISNVANGVADTDAVNVAQLKANSVKVVAGANITSVESQVTPNGTTYTINAKDTSASVSAASNALTVKAGEQNNGVIDYAIDLSDEIKASLNKANTGVQTVNGKDGITAEKQGDTVTVGLDDTTKASLAKADTAVQVVNGKNGITATKTDNGYDVELDENTKDSLAKADTAVQNITTKVNGKEVKTLNQADNSQDFVDGDNITITNDNGAIKVATKQNVSFTDVKTGTLTTTGDTTVGGTLTANGGLTVAGGQTVNMGNNRIQGVANGVADTDAVNVAQLNKATKALNDNINTAVNNTGWTVKANGDNGQKVANNGEVNFVQGDNIIIERSGTDITVNTTDNPNFKQVTAQSVQATTVNATTVNADAVNATTVNADAVNAKSVQADTVKTTGDVSVGGNLNATGTINAGGGISVAAGQPINMGGNVVNGVALAEISPSSTQAVNGAQIYELQQGINRANAQLNDRITGVEESAYGGTASAIATGLLPQAFNPGESLGGVAVGTYKGASAVAVGFSSISDNGKYIFKLAGGATSTGDYSGGAAFGIKFR